jgi:hypothetical protein
MDLPQQLSLQLKGMERLVDADRGAILFRHPNLRGIPDLVVEGDGYTMLCLDISNPAGMVCLLNNSVKTHLPVGI